MVTRSARVVRFVLRVGAAIGSVGAAAAFAATPPSGTLTDVSGPLTYTAGPFFASNASAQASGTPVCNAGLQCDDFALTVTLSPAVAAANRIKIQIQWPLSTADFDLYVLASNSSLAGKSATGNDPETVILPAVNDTYTVRVAPFNPAGQSFTGTISLVPLPPPGPPPPPGIAPRYRSYAAPPGGGDSSGEPSISIDWNPNNASLKHGTVNAGGVAFFTANTSELRVSFDDCSSPAKDLWENVTSPTEGLTTLDPIGFADHTTGRVYQVQLSGGQSRVALSDDDGATWMQAQGGPADQGPDHETLGGGPFAAGAPPHPTYPRAVYYCSQNVAAGAECGLSLDGGLTYLPGVNIFNPAVCTGGIHGHVKVGPDGAVYVPNSSCATGTGSQGVAVSTDNGVTWNDFTVPGSTGTGDPSVGIGAGNTVYLGWQNGDGHPHVAVSHDHGQTWTHDTDAGAALGIQNSVFPVVVAGDDDRAAFGFLGTPTGGNYQDSANFHGIWHFYIATTYDGGASWYLVDATPDDPVQVGSICTGGTTCGADRNLLDFNDISIDAQGRVLAAFADGCVAPGCNASSPSSSSRSAKATILRQSGGRRLLHAFDPVEPAAPPAPRLLSAVRLGGSVTVSWLEPDNAGSALTAYKIYRGTTSGGETLLATISPVKPEYVDGSANPALQYFYRVTAVNAQGEGPFCGEVSVVAGAAESPCVLPGITIVTDQSGDQSGAPANTELDIQKLSMAEPFLNSCSNQLVFTLKVADLTVVPPQARWTIFFSRGGTEYFVAMTSDNTGNPAGVSFVYGHTSTGTGGVRTLTTDGNADSGSQFAADGTITIVLSTSKLTFNLTPPPATLPPPMPGDTFGNINAITQQTVGVLLATIDSTGSNSYTMAGNRICEPNHPPIPQLAAQPKQGPAPLQVMFDGSGSSDPDLCDTVSSYTFDFGDGSPPVTQAGATINHTYTLDGDFRAQLTVTDSRGKPSAGSAQTVITVAGGSPACPAGGLCFYTVAPCRLFDSRGGSPLAADVEKTVQVGSNCGIPLTAKAVALNVTIDSPSSGGHLAVYPNSTPAPPPTSVLNFNPGQSRANNAVSALATGGQGTLEIRPVVVNHGTVEVIVDVTGYFQ